MFLSHDGFLHTLVKAECHNTDAENTFFIHSFSLTLKLPTVTLKALLLSLMCSWLSQIEPDC